MLFNDRYASRDNGNHEGQRSSKTMAAVRRKRAVYDEWTTRLFLVSRDAFEESCKEGGVAARLEPKLILRRCTCHPCMGLIK